MSCRLFPSGTHTRQSGYATHRRGFRLSTVLLSMLLLVACSARVELFSSSTESEANDVLAALLEADIHAEKLAKKSGIAISVSESDVARALEALRRRGLPRERFEGMGRIFHKEGMISSPLEERARYLYALSQELENTLSKMDGVLVARVHVVLPDQDPAKAIKTPASAAVFIKHQSDYNLDLLRPQIRTLVAHAIPDLSEDRVSVVLIAAYRASGPAAVAAGSIASPRDNATRASAVNGRWEIWLSAGVALLCAAAGGGVWAWRRRREATVPHRAEGIPPHAEPFEQA
jgi:type III secretion protein J